MSRKPFWQEGLKFQCQGSGKCCVSHGAYGFVFLTLSDRKRMAKHLGLTTAAFTRTYCDKKDDVWKLKDAATADCHFLKDKRCGIYEARPTQCRTWPFWPEVLEARAWQRDVVSFCPGVGKGKLWSKQEIEAQLNLQKASEGEYGS